MVVKLEEKGGKFCIRKRLYLLFQTKPYLLKKKYVRRRKSFN